MFFFTLRQKGYLTLFYPILPRRQELPLSRGMASISASYRFSFQDYFETWQNIKSKIGTEIYHNKVSNKMNFLAVAILFYAVQGVFHTSYPYGTLNHRIRCRIFQLGMEDDNHSVKLRRITTKLFSDFCLWITTLTNKILHQEKPLWVNVLILQSESFCNFACRASPWRDGPPTPWCWAP